MNCQIVKDNMLDYAEGSVSADLKTAISDHLNACTSCQGYHKLVLGFLRAVDAEKAVAVNPFLLTRIEEKIKSSKKVPVLPLRTRILRTYYSYAAVIVLTLTIGVFAGMQLGNLMNKNGNNVVITSETELLKQDFYLNEIEKDDFSQVLNNQ